jgi:HEAT repeat protein
MSNDETFESLIATIYNTNTNAHKRQRAAYALGELRNTRAIDPLIIVMHDADPAVRDSAASALAQFGGAAVKPLFSKLRSTHSHARYLAARTLREIGWTPNTPAEQVLVDGALRHWAVLPMGGQPALKLLISYMYDNDPSIRQEAAYTLGEMGDHGAANALLAGLHDDDVLVRWRSAEALGKMKELSAVKPLIATLDDRSPKVRLVAAWALGRIGDARAIEGLVHVLPDRRVAFGKRVGDIAAWALEMMDNPEASQALQIWRSQQAIRG